MAESGKGSFVMAVVGVIVTLIAIYALDQMFFALHH